MPPSAYRVIAWEPSINTAVVEMLGLQVSDHGDVKTYSCADTGSPSVRTLGREHLRPYGHWRLDNFRNFYNKRNKIITNIVYVSVY